MVVSINPLIQIIGDEFVDNFGKRLNYGPAQFVLQGFDLPAHVF